MTNHCTPPIDNQATHNSLTDGEILRYSRQILLDEFDLEGQLNLKRACVLVLGVGGLGSCVLPILARAGVGRLHFVDNDTIDESNLQRQMLFFDKDIGQKKAITAQRTLAEHNPWVKLFCHDCHINTDSLNALLADIKPDLVLDCTDNFVARYAINQACINQNTPLLSASAIGTTGQLALFESDTGCYACVFGQNATHKDNCATSGVLASTVSVMASLQADAALKFLAQKTNPLASTLLIWQGARLSLRSLRYKKNKHCPVCGNHAPNTQSV